VATHANHALASTGLLPLSFACAGFSKHGVYWEMIPGQIIAALAAVVAISLLCWSGRLSYRLFPVIPTKRTRDTIHLIYVLPTVVW